MKIASPFTRSLSDLARDRRGLAMLEFAFAMPLVLMTGAMGIECANVAVTQLRVSQIALALADNAARVGERTTLATQELREADVNDILQAVRIQGEKLAMTERGRITLTSLEAGADGVQRVHWQRCIGRKSGVGYDTALLPKASISDGSDSSTANQGPSTPDGYGPTGRKVIAPPRSGVMFVEINYQYKPIIGSYGILPSKVQQIASFVVRDNRDFRRLYNPTPAATPSTCNLYAA